MTLRQYNAILDEETHEVELSSLENGYELRLGDTTHRFEILMKSATLYSFLIDGSHVLEVDLNFHQDRCELNIDNIPYHLEVFDPRRRILSQGEGASGGGLIAAPMPGKIIDIKVAVGDKVEKGQALVTIEAMKMQNELTSPITGVVQEIAIESGTAVEANQKLVVVVKEA